MQEKIAELQAEVLTARNESAASRVAAAEAAVAIAEATRALGHVPSPDEDLSASVPAAVRRLNSVVAKEAELKRRAARRKARREERRKAAEESESESQAGASTSRSLKSVSESDQHEQSFDDSSDNDEGGAPPRLEARPRLFAPLASISCLALSCVALCFSSQPF